MAQPADANVDGRRPVVGAQLAGGTDEQATTQDMDKMATTVTRAAEMCEMMMTKEMATMRYKVAAGVAFGLVLFLDLVLLAVLEVQWIIH